MVERNHVLIVAHDSVSCAICRRTLLTGERASLTSREPGSEFVCQLCVGAGHESVPEGGATPSRQASVTEALVLHRP